ncbi:MAG: hypothetical protein RBT75_15835 [Anaerolineae bacterium]|jgi:hypothetical protein|nr:hypothetical protein [Anaerolineae bacterium]
MTSAAYQQMCREARKTGFPRSFKTDLHLLLGADSYDGTFPCHAPDIAAQRLSQAVQQPELLQLR